MNEKVFIAKIYWLRPNQGGRKQGVPLHMKKYCPIVSVDGKNFFQVVRMVCCVTHSNNSLSV